MAPFETFMIPTRVRYDNRTEIQTAETLAEEISATYERVANRGGKVVMQHYIENVRTVPGDQGVVTIVADIPSPRKAGERLDDEVGARPSLEPKLSRIVQELGNE